MTHEKAPHGLNVRGSVIEAKPTKLAFDIEIGNQRSGTSRRGRVLAIFDLTIVGVGTVRNFTVRWSRREQCYEVHGPGAHTTFEATGWIEHVAFDDELKAAILEIVVPRLDTDRACAS